MIDQADAIETNRTILQGFEWHTFSRPPADHEPQSSSSHYSRLVRLLPRIAELGVTDLWLPPGCKADNPHGNGYDCYDLWDLGEFVQKASRSTRWGSREELDNLIRTAHDHGLKVIWDAVLNHKAGGDGTERCWAVEVDPRDRTIEIGTPEQIQAWLRFDFPGRSGKYSDFKWRAEHFNGTDWDQDKQRKAILKLIDPPEQRDCLTAQSFEQVSQPSRRRLMSKLLTKQGSSRSQPRSGKGWAHDVDDQLGNHDYLMFSNIDFTRAAVRQDVIRWANWMIQEARVGGFRIDAALHISRSFVKDLYTSLRQAHGQGIFFVGEVWTGEVERIEQWLNAVGAGAYAFDAPLLMSFSQLGQSVERGDKGIDLRIVSTGSLLEHRPESSVTLVTNHDTQPGQTSFMPMSDWMKTLAYTYILLRSQGTPCVFWGDLYGTEGPHAESPACTQHGRQVLADLMTLRSLFAYGQQKDYFDDPACIAWSRAGTTQRPGCVVMLSIASQSTLHRKEITAGRPGEIWIDILGGASATQVTIGEQSLGDFSCAGRCAAVYVKQEDSERFRRVAG